MFVEIVHVKKSNHYPSQDFLIPQLQVIAKTRDQIKKKQCLSKITIQCMIELHQASFSFNRFIRILY